MRKSPSSFTREGWVAKGSFIAQLADQPFCSAVAVGTVAHPHRLAAALIAVRLAVLSWDKHLAVFDSGHL